MTISRRIGLFVLLALVAAAALHWRSGTGQPTDKRDCPEVVLSTDVRSLGVEPGDWKVHRMLVVQQDASDNGAVAELVRYLRDHGVHAVEGEQSDIEGAAAACAQSGHDGLLMIRTTPFPELAGRRMHTMLVSHVDPHTAAMKHLMSFSSVSTMSGEQFTHHAGAALLRSGFSD